MKAERMKNQNEPVLILFDITGENRTLLQLTKFFQKPIVL